MQPSTGFAPRYPTDQEIRRGLDRGRRERALAFRAAFKALFVFLIGRKVDSIADSQKAIRHAC